MGNIVVVGLLDLLKHFGTYEQFVSCFCNDFCSIFGFEIILCIDP